MRVGANNGPLSALYSPNLVYNTTGGCTMAKETTESKRARCSAAGKLAWLNGGPKRDPEVYAEAKRKYWKDRRHKAWEEDSLEDVGISDVGAKRALAEHVGDYCHICKLPPVWQGQLLILHLHHINGNRYNNKKANLQLLCPNCHSQTESYNVNTPKYKK
jgi:5-methylcytosine-specific restriction endonuclease McrA